MLISKNNFYGIEIGYVENDIEHFYKMLIERYSNSILLSTEIYQAVIKTMLENYQRILNCERRTHENDRVLSNLLTKNSEERKNIKKDNENSLKKQEGPNNIDELLELLRKLNQKRLYGGYYLNVGRDMNGNLINEDSESGFKIFLKDFSIITFWFELISKKYSMEDEKVIECKEIIRNCRAFSNEIQNRLNKRGFIH